MATTGKKGTASSPRLKARLTALEKQAAERGLHVHYDLLEAAGLKLKDGICKIREEYHIFIDRRKPDADKIEKLEDFLGQPPPRDIPEHAESSVPGEEVPAVEEGRAAPSPGGGDP